MVFKSVGGSRLGGAATCVVGTRGWPAKQDHPAYIPRILRPVWALHDGYPSLLAAQDASAPGTFPPSCGPCPPPLSPIGLTAAGLFAGGEVSRADSRVR